MSATVPPTVVPLPDTIVGAQQDDSGNIIQDDFGNPIIMNRLDQILDAIYALAKEVRKMSGTEQAVETAVATLVASETVEASAWTAVQTDLASIQKIIGGLQPSDSLSPATLAALQAAVGSAQTNATTGQGVQATADSIAAGTNTATATST